MIIKRIIYFINVGQLGTYGIKRPVDRLRGSQRGGLAVKRGALWGRPSGRDRLGFGGAEAAPQTVFRCPFIQ